MDIIASLQQVNGGLEYAHVCLLLENSNSQFAYLNANEDYRLCLPFFQILFHFRHNHAEIHLLHHLGFLRKNQLGELQRISKHAMAFPNTSLSKFGRILLGYDDWQLHDLGSTEQRLGCVYHSRRVRDERLEAFLDIAYE